MSYFNFIGYAYGEASYLATTFITAVKTIYNDNIKDDPYKTSSSQYIPKWTIQSNKIESIGKINIDFANLKRGLQI